jgi:GNAT superfamily N-acetyltransferase
MPLERPEILALSWSPGTQAPGLPGRDPLIHSTDRRRFAHVQAAIGFTVTDAAWSELTATLVPDAMVFVVRSGAPVAVAAAQWRGDWIELGWVAVVPDHRGQGLGHHVCAGLVRHLLAHGHTALFGSTQDHRLAALRIYLALGFEPVVRPHNRDRWARVHQQLG